MCIKYTGVAEMLWTGTALPPLLLRPPEFTAPGDVVCVARSLVVCVIFFVDPFVLLFWLLDCLSFDIRLITNYIFGIFKLFFLCPCCSFLVVHVCSIWLWRNLVIVLGNRSSKRYKLLVIPEPCPKTNCFDTYLKHHFVSVLCIF